MNAKILGVLGLLMIAFPVDDIIALGYPQEDVARKDVTELLARLNFRVFIKPLENNLVYIHMVMERPTEKTHVWDLGLHLQQGTNMLGFLKLDAEELTHPELKKTYGKQPLLHASFTLAETFLTNSTLTISDVVKPLRSPFYDSNTGGSYRITLNDLISASSTNGTGTCCGSSATPNR